MKRKRWFLVGFLILSTLFMETSCWLTATRKTHTPTPDPRRTFTMEYDCQISYNILSPSGRTQRLQLAFNPANTDLYIIRDEESLTDSVIHWNDKGLYISWHWTTTGGPDPRLVWKSYFISVNTLSNIPDEEPGKPMIGWSPIDNTEGLSLGMILTGRIRLLFSPSDSMEIKTTLHEWGHMRTNLTHLCEDVLNHDQGDCLMAQGEFAECTSQWVNQNMHFCGMCINKLKEVEW